MVIAAIIEVVKAVPARKSSWCTVLAMGTACLLLVGCQTAGKSPQSPGQSPESPASTQVASPSVEPAVAQGNESLPAASAAGSARRVARPAGEGGRALEGLSGGAARTWNRAYRAVAGELARPVRAIEYGTVAAVLILLTVGITATLRARRRGRLSPTGAHK